MSASDFLCSEGFLVPVRECRIGGEDAGLVRGEAELVHVAAAPRAGQLGECRVLCLDEAAIDQEWRQVGLGEVAVVIRRLLVALVHRVAHRVVPAARRARRVLDRASVLVVLPALALHLALDAQAHVAHGVDVLHLDDGRPIAVFEDEVDVGLAAQVAFLHVAVRRADIADDLAQGFEVAFRLPGRRDVRFRDDFEQRRAGPVEIHATLVAALVVGGLARVFLQVRADEAHRLEVAVIVVDLDAAADAERLIELTDLIALRQVGIEVVLAVPLRDFRDLAAEREPGADGQPDRLAIQHGQGARQAEHRRVRERVRIGAVVVWAGREALGLRIELEVDLHAHDQAARIDGAHAAPPASAAGAS